MLEKGARWTALENKDLCLSPAQEEGHCKPPRFAMSALSSPVLAESRKEQEGIRTPSRLGKGAKQHPGDDDGFAHPPTPARKQTEITHFTQGTEQNLSFATQNRLNLTQ